MNGSPAKLGTISGTAGHSSALKMKADENAASALKQINKDGTVAVPALDKSKKTKHGTKTYKSAYDEMKTEVPRVGKTDKYGNKYKSQKDFEKAADKWWASEAGQKKAKSDKKFSHRIAKKDESTKPTKTEKVIAKGETKKAKITAKATKKTAEVTENVDKKTAKISRREAKKKHGKGSKEHLQAKKAHLEAKEADRQGSKGGKKQSIFRRLSSKINKRRQAKVDKKLAEKE